MASTTRIVYNMGDMYPRRRYTNLLAVTIGFAIANLMPLWTTTLPIVGWRYR